MAPMLVLWLLRRRPEMNGVMAARLDREAFQLNRRGLFALLMLWAATWLCCIMAPFLMLACIPLWISVLSCAYADIFEGGYAIKALAPLAVPSLRLRMLRSASLVPATLHRSSKNG